MSLEVPKCLKSFMCITCVCQGVCIDFADSKIKADEGYVHNPHRANVMKIINGYWERVYHVDKKVS